MMSRDTPFGINVFIELSDGWTALALKFRRTGYAPARMPRITVYGCEMWNLGPGLGCSRPAVEGWALRRRITGTPLLTRGLPHPLSF